MARFNDTPPVTRRPAKPLAAGKTRTTLRKAKVLTAAQFERAIELAVARDATIRDQAGRIATLRGNEARLEAEIGAQGASIERAREEARQRQAEAAAAVELAQRGLREAAAREQAWKNIAAVGDRSQGANYAFDSRRAGASR